LILGITPFIDPGVGESCTAGESSVAVDHENFSMSAVVATRRLQDVEGVVEVDFGSGLAEVGEMIFV